jgi:hypothetical protein
MAPTTSSKRTAIYNYYVKNSAQVANLKLSTIGDWLNCLQKNARERLAFLVAVMKSSDATGGDMDCDIAYQVGLPRVSNELYRTQAELTFIGTHQGRRYSARRKNGSRYCISCMSTTRSQLVVSESDRAKFFRYAPMMLISSYKKAWIEA